MQFSKNFEGAKVIIKDEESKKNLLESVVSKHNLTYGMIDVEGKLWEIEGRDQVEVIITMGGERYLFKGIVQRLPREKNIQIALYKGSTKEERIFKRFTLSTYAAIEKVYNKDGIKIGERQAIVEVENISSSGIQFVGSDRLLVKEGTFLMNLSITAKGSRHVKGRVIWKEAMDHGQALYGCEFYK